MNQQNCFARIDDVISIANQIPQIGNYGIGQLILEQVKQRIAEAGKEWCKRLLQKVVK